MDLQTRDDLMNQRVARLERQNQALVMSLKRAYGLIHELGQNLGNLNVPTVCKQQVSTLETLTPRRERDL